MPSADYYRMNPYAAGYGVEHTSPIAILSLVLSIVSVPLVCFWQLSLCCAAVGAVLGMAGLRGNRASRGLSIAGLVVGLAMAVVILVLVFQYNRAFNGWR